MDRTLTSPQAEPVSDRERSNDRAVDLSVVIPVSDRVEPLAALHRRMREALSATGRSMQVIYVVDGAMHGVLDELRRLAREDADVEVFRLNRWFGEATALAVGLDRARGATVLTLPAYPQVEPQSLPRLLDAFDAEDVDLVMARRHPRVDSWFNRLQSRVFHGLTGMLTGVRYHDLSCGVRVMNRAVATDVDLYGDLHRFFPLLAYQKGFRVREVAVPQSKDDARRRVLHPGAYLRRLLDILTLFFIFKFTKKPLRFFGLVGSAVFGVGAVILGYLGVYRILQFGPIGDRPLLILGTLLVVLGTQLFSIGLLGEIIIFTHAGSTKDYRVQERTHGESRDGVERA